MRKLFSIFLIYFLIFSFEISAQKFRSTSFDDRQICEDAKGVWRQFGNGCADQCRAKFDEFSICTRAITNACECGKNRCWSGETCITLKEYQKIYDKEQIAEQKILDAAKEKRKADAQENAKEIITKINANLANDPNNPKKNDQQQAVNVSVQQTAPVVQPAPIVQVVPTEQQTTISNPQVPPLFLQQEQAKKNTAVNNALNSAESQKNKNGLLDSSVPVGLPEIPLPN